MSAAGQAVTLRTGIRSFDNFANRVHVYFHTEQHYELVTKVT
jgi:hypothetical protein